jgi:hypothetical protein
MFGITTYNKPFIIPLDGLTNLDGSKFDKTLDLFDNLFTEPCRVRVVEQVLQNAPHFTVFIRNLFDNRGYRTTLLLNGKYVFLNLGATWNPRFSNEKNLCRNFTLNIIPVINLQYWQYHWVKTRMM